MGVTIKDVAKAAGVSSSTVSRVIADHPKISIETKERVTKVMEELGYYPNAFAQSLASKSTQTIGVIVPKSTTRALENPFFADILGAISEVAHEHGFDILLSISHNKKEELEIVKRLVRSKRVDGALLLTCSQEDIVVKELKENEFPFVVIGRPQNDQGVHWVDNDNEQAAYEVTTELIKAGKKDIAFMAADLFYIVNHHRLLGYQRALREHNIPYDDRRVIITSVAKQGGAEAMEHLLHKKIPIDGAVIVDDVISFGAIQTLQKYGYRIPQDVAIGSFNNIALAQYCNPPLSSVEVHSEELGKKATKILMDAIKDFDIKEQHVIVSSTLMIRDSIHSKTE